MKLKSISKLLVFGILLNNIPINSFASLLSEDTRYETFIDNDITINNVLEEDKIDLKIEGNSISNIVKENQRAVLKGSINGSYLNHYVNLYYPLKANTTYTLSLNVTKNTYNHPPFSSIVLGQGDVNTGFGLDDWSCRLYWDKDFEFEKDKSNLGIHNVTFTTPSRIEESSFYSIIFIGQIWDTFDTVIEDIFITENNLSNTQIKHFDSIQSSFEDQLITQEIVASGEESFENLGKYKAEYKSTGKNKFNTTVPYNTRNGFNLSHLEDGKTYTVSTSNNNIRDIKISTGVHSPVPGDDVLKAVKGRTMTFVYNKSKDWNLYVWADDNWTCYNDEVVEIQIEEGINKTDYEPYKESINTFYLNSPLLEGDTIEYINGQTYHIKRSGEALIDGVKGIYSMINDNSNDRYSQFNIGKVVDNKANSAFILSDKFKTANNVGDSSDVMLEGITAIHNNVFVIRIKNNRLSTLNEDGFRNWLKKNPVKIIYELKSPIYEPIKANLVVNLFEGTTHILNNSTIPATMEVTVDRALNRAVEYTELAKVNPTINNLSKARYWNNLLKDSIKKDQLQEEVSNITALNDIELERKNVTSNLDLYIKSENILMMSLNTNSITFEDFSGVEDMEKIGALQISINSSLPYSLNAYLPIEIQNSDKSVIMNKDILNIKENSETAYQTFANTADKIVLKDNNSAGNDLIHNIDIKLKGGIAHQKDVYKTTIKFEAQQK